MRHEFSFEFSPALVRSALKRNVYWKGVSFILFIAVVLVAYRLWSGIFPPSLLLVSVGCTAFVLIRLNAALRSAANQIHEAWLEQSPDGRITWRLFDDAFEVLVGSGSARYEWAGLRRLRRHADVWSLEIVKGTSVFFPPGDAPEEAREFITESCRGAGVQV